jgi:hypothetical protein
MAHTLREMASTVRGGIDLQSAADRHPWGTIGVAALIGALAGRLVSRQEQAEAAKPPDQRTVEPQISPLVSSLISIVTMPAIDLFKEFVEGIIHARPAPSDGPPRTTPSD